MATALKSGLQFAHRENVAVRGRKRTSIEAKEILAAKGVVEEVMSRVIHFRSDSKIDKAKEKHEKEVEAKVEEKSRAAAWAWYEHGNGAVLTSGGGTPTLGNRLMSPPVVRKSSRFKTEALNVTYDSSGRLEPAGWDFESSLFDPYELNSVSKKIDSAFQESQIIPRASPAPNPASKLTKSGSFRALAFPRSLCRSISVVVSPEEMALKGKKCECRNEVVRPKRSGWGFRKLSKALHGLLYVSASDFSHQEERTSYHHDHHHHHHLHDHHHHHHHHFSIKMKDGRHYGKSYSNVDHSNANPFPGRPYAR